VSNQEEASGSSEARQLVINTTVYSLDTVKKAAYRFLDRFVLDFQVHGEEILCTLTFPRGVSPAAAENAVQAFKNELLDQDLRQKVAAETAPLRNTILALAFASTNPQRRE
jgi:His-Xaa-Ser system protein HxsD